MKIVKMHELKGAESLAVLLHDEDYVAVEDGDHDVIMSVCDMESIATGGFHLKQCANVIGLFVVNVSHGQSFLVVGPGNDRRPFYATQDELRASLIESLSEAPLWQRTQRWFDRIGCCVCAKTTLLHTSLMRLECNK
jgi:hypothetical protein